MFFVKTVTIVVVAVVAMEPITALDQVQVKPDDLEDVFREAKLLDVTLYHPAELLYVKYPEREVNYGNSINVLDTLVEPKVKWNDTDEDADPESLYTLIFMNVDIGRPQYLHWMVNNIRHLNFAKAQKTVNYKFPDPPRGTEIFRMLFIVYRQPELKALKYDETYFLGKERDRSRFDLLKFVVTYNFSEYPVAGNFFYQGPRMNRWVPRNPPAWMKPFLPYLTKERDYY